MTTRHMFKALAVTAALGLALTACGDSDDGDNGNDGGDSAQTLSTIDSGKLTVCSDAPYEPFDVIEGSTFTGFDGDLVTEIAKGLDLELVAIDSAFDPLQSGLALNSGQCDMAASAMTITDERAEKLTFSEGYYDSKQSLLVPVGSDITSIDDLDGKKVGVQNATTGKAYTEENAQGAKVVSFPDDAAMFTALKGGTVDALLQDLPVNLEHTKDGKYEIVEEYSTDEAYGFAFKKEGSEDLVEAVNDQLQELRDNGKYQEIYDKYFTAG
ncbi:MAG TPA: transporter substrate-binding domain-containing protein [Marmoricola sp.]